MFMMMMMMMGFASRLLPSVCPCGLGRLPVWRWLVHI